MVRNGAKTMAFSIDSARKFAEEAVYLRHITGANEDALRHLLSTHLRTMFPGNPAWIREYAAGTETSVAYTDKAGAHRTQFLDSLVGTTIVEYEKDLTVKSVYTRGYNQLKEYTTRLLNNDVPHEHIFALLSDTVRWIAFRVEITSEVSEGQLYSSEHVSLRQIAEVDLQDRSDQNLRHFGAFMYRFYWRRGFRVLTADTVVMDLGLSSQFCREHIEGFRSIVDKAFEDRPRYGSMITTLWQRFVNYLENDQTHGLDKNAYANELYVMTLAKLLAANILNGEIVKDQGDNIKRILNGEWFRERGFVNLVEFDYFGWIHEEPFIEPLASLAREMQQALMAYDYERVKTEDLFGPLMAQLADKDRRLLLGQEYTPQWLTRKMVARALDLLPEGEFPNFVDMCCGSGAFIVETLSQTKQRYEIAPGVSTDIMMRRLTNCIVGFDIDPLAVLLSKLNWALSMREFLPHLQGDLIIPVYHADSLFAAAPITPAIDGDYTSQELVMDFDGEQVSLPGFLLSPENRDLFDALIHACYETAKNLVKPDTPVYSQSDAHELVRQHVLKYGARLGQEQLRSIGATCYRLILTLERLQRDDRNGIWPFLLGNGYKPGLVRDQFNGIVSNPPWMALSRLADNPYKSILVSRAERYGIKPPGSSHLHVELATIFLLSSVDKYLRSDSTCVVVMPDTLLAGYHHEPFRNQTYKSADWSVDFQVSEIWDVPADTFKNKAIILIGAKVGHRNTYPIRGRKVSNLLPDEHCSYSLIRQGNRSAWSPNSNARDLTDGVLEPLPFRQGADIMPRTLVFHDLTRQPNGRWNVRPIPRQGHELSYLVNDAKDHVNFSLNVQNVDDRFVFDCFLSKHILPLMVSEPAKALLPIRKLAGNWTVVSQSQYNAYGTATATAFRQILNRYGGSAQEFFDKALNCRKKLEQQRFDSVDNSKWLVMAGAGGQYTTAAAIPFGRINKSRTIIDQTLYWYIADTEDEALYLVGMLNSKALDAGIFDFQPAGAMGRRHIHTLPYYITPRFDPINPSHASVVASTRVLINSLSSALPNSDVHRFLAPSSSTLQVRRRRLREFISRLPESRQFEEACRAVYNV